MKFSVTEREIEAYLVKKVKAMGGIAYKFTSPGRTGVPDRIVVLPNGVLAFVEVKKSSGKLSARQISEIMLLQKLGHWVEVVFSKEQVDELMEALTNE